MATAGAIGHTTTLTWNVTEVAEVTSIGGVNITATEVDSTSLGSADYFMELIPGLLKAGPFDIAGVFKPADTDGQVALLTDMLARTIRAFTITFPTALATTWTGNAYVTKFATGDVTSEGMLTFAATLSINGKPSLNITSVTGMTGLTGTETSGAITIEPTIDAATWTYNSVTNLTGAWITLTPVGAGQTFDIVALGVTHTVATGVATGHITVGAADTVTVVYIEAKESGKASKNYTLTVTYP